MEKRPLLVFAILALIPIQIFAHGGHGTGFTAGITHPIFGIDHLVAIIGIGVMGFTVLKEKKWLPSLVFILSMVIGGFLGIKSEAFKVTEWMIVGSVLISGLILALDFKMSSILYISLAAIFGFFHGHAHGTEMPQDSNIPLYILGFVIDRKSVV